MLPLSWTGTATRLCIIVFAFSDMLSCVVEGRECKRGREEDTRCNTNAHTHKPRTPYPENENQHFAPQGRVKMNTCVNVAVVRPPSCDMFFAGFVAFGRHSVSRAATREHRVGAYSQMTKVTIFLTWASSGAARMCAPVG